MEGRVSVGARFGNSSFTSGSLTGVPSLVLRRTYLSLCVFSLLSESGRRKAGVKVRKWGLAGGSEGAAGAGVAGEWTRALSAEGAGPARPPWVPDGQRLALVPLVRRGLDS